MKLWKKLLSCFLVFALFMPAAACGDKTDYTPTVTAGNYAFAKDDPADVAITVDLKGKTLNEVKKGSDKLAADDYSSTNTKLTLKSAYLMTLTVAEHDFSLSTDGGTASFKINVTAITTPVITNPALSYDWATGGDLVVAANFRGEAVTALLCGQDTMTKDEDYTVQTDSITIIEDYLSGLTEGENGFTLKTAGGSADFTVNISDSAPHVNNPGNTYLVQTATTADLVFGFDAKGYDIAVKVDNNLIEKDTHYTYADKKLTLKGTYLTGLEIGVKKVEVEIDNPLENVLTFYAGVCGADGKTRLVAPDVRGAATLNNYEGYQAGGTAVVGESTYPINDVYQGGPVSYSIVGADDENSINGKSMKISYAFDGVKFFYGVGTTSGFNKGVLNVYKFKLRGDTRATKAQKLIVTGDNDALCSDIFEIYDLNAADSVVTKKDNRSGATWVADAKGGYWDVEVYWQTANNIGKIVLALVSDNADSALGNINLYFDDVMLAQTEMPINPSDASCDVFDVNNPNDVDITVSSKAVITGLKNGGTSLTEGTDYTMSGNVATVKAAYLTDKAFPLTLTVVYSAYTKYNVYSENQTLSANISRTKSLTDQAGTLGIINYDSTGSSGAVFPINLGSGTISAITAKSLDNALTVDEALTASDYTYTAANKYLTVSKSYFAEKAAGRYEFTVTTSESKTVKFVVNKDIVKSTVTQFKFRNAEDTLEGMTGTYRASTFGFENEIAFNYENHAFAKDPTIISKSKEYMVKFRVKLTGTVELQIWLGDGAGQTLIFSGATASLLGQGIAYNVIDLGNGYYDICAYGKGNDVKPTYPIKGNWVLGEYALYEVNAGIVK